MIVFFCIGLWPFGTFHLYMLLSPGTFFYEAILILDRLIRIERNENILRDLPPGLHNLLWYTNPFAALSFNLIFLRAVERVLGSGLRFPEIKTMSTTCAVKHIFIWIVLLCHRKQ